MKFYIVPSPGNGPAKSLFTIAARTLGDGSRFVEIFNLNKGRLLPNGGRLTGVVEAGLHGFKFFTFRETGAGESGPTVPTDQQFVAQQAAAAKAHMPGRPLGEEHIGTVNRRNN